MAFVKTPQLEGVAALTAQLKRLESLDQGKVLKSTVKAGINVALRHARDNIPVGGRPGGAGVTGHSSHEGRVETIERTYTGRKVPVGFAKTQLRTGASINSTKDVANGLLTTTKDAYYALNFLELGTRYTFAQPWIRKSLQEAQGEIEETVAAQLAAGINKAVSG